MLRSTCWTCAKCVITSTTKRSFWGGVITIVSVNLSVCYHLEVIWQPKAAQDLLWNWIHKAFQQLSSMSLTTLLKRGPHFEAAYVLWRQSLSSKCSVTYKFKYCTTLPHARTRENAEIQRPHYDSGTRIFYTSYLHNLWWMGSSSHLLT